LKWLPSAGCLCPNRDIDRQSTPPHRPSNTFAWARFA